MTDNRYIRLEPVKADRDKISFLEDHGLIINPFKTDFYRGLSEAAGEKVEAMYVSMKENGAHQFLSVFKNTTEIELNYHSDNEDIIILKPPDVAFKPLYIIFGLLSCQDLEDKASSGKLKDSDFLCLEWPYNDPELSLFTIPSGTVHCEVTCAGPGLSPVFFVTEPSAMKMTFFNSSGYILSI